MECAEHLYRERDSAASPLFWLFEEHFEELRRIYPDRSEETYGPWQRHWDGAVAAFLVIEKILRHIGRWRRSRGPPAPRTSPGEYRVLYDEQPPGDAFIPDDLPPPDPCDRPWSPEA